MKARHKLDNPGYRHGPTAVLIRLLVLTACLLSTQAGLAQPRINSVEEADRVLGAIVGERKVVEAGFLEDERVCRSKFFATACLDAAQERHRLSLARLRALEVEANRFKRRARADQRDQERNQKHNQDQ